MKILIFSLFQKFKFVLSYLFKNEFDEKNFLKSVLEEGSTVIDVGSNVGSFIDQINRINTKTKIYSIEPNKDLIHFQQKKFKNYFNITYSNLAISDKNKTAIFYLRNSLSHSSLTKYHNESLVNKITNEVKVKVVTLEEFLISNKITEVTLLKIDTEGNELKILNNSISLIKNGLIKFIKVECNKDLILDILNYCQNNRLEILGFSNIFYLKNKFEMCDIFLKNTNKI